VTRRLALDDRVEDEVLDEVVAERLPASLRDVHEQEQLVVHRLS
jgi:hypothetical protein